MRGLNVWTEENLKVPSVAFSSRGTESPRFLARINIVYLAGW
jgi:hypothetical protein